MHLTWALGQGGYITLQLSGRALHECGFRVLSWTSKVRHTIVTTLPIHMYDPNPSHLSFSLYPQKSPLLTSGQNYV